MSKTQPQKFWSEIRKIQGKANNNLNLPPSDFFDHFQNLYSAQDMFVNEDVENYFSNEEASEIKIDQLDRDFCIAEVEKAICCLKRQRSCGVDLLISEIFIESNTIYLQYYVDFLISCTIMLFIQIAGQRES